MQLLFCFALHLAAADDCEIAEFAGLNIAGLDNDGLEIGGLVPAAPAAAVP